MTRLARAKRVRAAGAALLAVALAGCAQSTSAHLPNRTVGRSWFGSGRGFAIFLSYSERIPALTLSGTLYITTRSSNLGLSGGSRSIPVTGRVITGSSEGGIELQGPNLSLIGGWGDAGRILTLDLPGGYTISLHRAGFGQYAAAAAAIERG